LNRNHDSVVDHFLMVFANWLHHCIVDDLFASFIHRLANGVIDYLFVCFTNWNHYSIVDNLFMVLNHRPHDCVLYFFAMRVVHRTTNVVRYLVRLCLPDRLHDGVFTSPSLINRLANRLVDGSCPSFSLHPSNIDYLVFGNRLILSACSLNSLLLVNRTTHCSHYGVRCRSFPATCATTGILVAYRSAVRGMCATGKCSQQGYQNRYD